MKRTTRRLVAAAAVTITGLALSGCSAGSGGGGDGTIELWIRDYEKALVEPLAEAYNASHETQVEITLVPSPSYVQKLATSIAGGDPPDVAALDLVFTPYFAQAGALVDITDRVDALGYADDFSPAHASVSSFDDRTYAVPFTGDASVLFYNKTLFAEAGLDPERPPTTHAEIRAAAKAITALGDSTYGYSIPGACGGCLIFGFTPLIWGGGGDVLSADGRTATLDSPEVTEGLELLRGMWTDGSMPSLARTDAGPNTATAFQQGTVGMIADGTATMGSLVAGGKVDFGVTPLPGKDGGSASFGGGDTLAILDGAEDADAAWEFVEWATGEEAQTILAEQSVVPIRTDLLDEVYVPQDPRYAVFADALRVGHVPFSPVENELFNDNNGVWVNLISQSVFGGGIPEAQREAQAEAQRILDSVVYLEEDEK
ncbi:ABC transporter substrate-binding protein [Clavibacter michiganensis]|uniref:ABC transporter substrate-binding protein n=1 Tax=Clavibacter michiganensis TaxID=28447 RepID=UPI0005BBA822|nr:sugar ABC transporter substrate-binding protein [Clavibacter michiganensis]